MNQLVENTPAGAPARGAPRGSGPARFTQLNDGRIRRQIGRGLSVVAFSAALLICLITVVVPMVLGAQSYTVLTGSMQPTYPPGTLIVVRPVPVDDLRTGDVVTFQINSGESTVVTHRVVGFGTTPEGQRSLVTQGDDNTTPDATAVMPVQVRGKLIYAVPWAGYVGHALGTAGLSTGDGPLAGRSVVVITAIAGLFGYGMVMVALGVRERTQRPAVSTSPAHRSPVPVRGSTLRRKRRHARH